MKGIILAGGFGTRLHPITLVVSKQLLPVYDKPMIYYSLSVLILAKIKDILIISTPNDIENFRKLLNDGSHLGIKISYAIQPTPDGLAQAFIIGEEFIGTDNVCLILGDNIFYGAGLHKLLWDSVEKVEKESKAINFGYWVKNPERYGVAEFNADGNLVSIEEKPSNPKSNYAIVGLYFYPNSVIEIAKTVKPSARNELEITSVNLEYLSQNKLLLTKMSRGYAWLDTGTHESLSEATEFVKTVENRTGLKIGCIEEVAYRVGFIAKEDLIRLSEKYKNNGYGDYLKSIN